MRLLCLPCRHKPLSTGLVFVNPIICISAVLNFRQNLFHRLFGFLSHHARTARVISMLGSVADRVPHVVQSTSIKQIDDQFQFVHTLEISDLRLISSLNKRLESRFD